MPWASLTAVFVGTISRSGVQAGDGWIAIGLAVPLFVFGVRAARGLAPAPARWATAISLLLVALALFEITDVSNKISSVNTQASGFGHADVGSGLWVLVLGSVAALVGGLLALRQRSQSAETQ